MDPQPASEIRPRARLAVARDVATAERWRDALEAAGVDALIEIDDERSSMLGGAPTAFVYPVTVLPEERERAAAVLIDHGWDGRRSNRRPAHGAPIKMGTAIRGALIVVALSLALVILLAEFG